jgi:hypothetical protein
MLMLWLCVGLQLCDVLFSRSSIFLPVVCAYVGECIFCTNGCVNKTAHCPTHNMGLQYNIPYIYRVSRGQADWSLTHTSHKDTEQSTREASITLDGVTLTDSLIRRSPKE